MGSRKPHLAETCRFVCLELIECESSRIANNQVCGSQLDSLQAWKAFASVFPFESDALLQRRHQVVRRPDMRLGDYIKSISSPLIQWITFLTLSHITCTRTDLIQLWQLPNIGVLTIGPSVLAEEIGIDDGIIRSWARIAATSDAFSMLRVLSYRSQKDLTPAVFSHLALLPALAILYFEDCSLGSKHKTDALCHGWKYRTGKILSDCLVSGGSAGAGWDSVMHASFHMGGSYSTPAMTAEGVDAIDGLPRLHLSLGGSPQDAAVDMTGDRSLKSFYRATPIPIQSSQTTESSSHKRPLSQGQWSAIEKTHKRPSMRLSKQQNMETLLMGLGG